MSTLTEKLKLKKKRFKVVIDTERKRNKFRRNREVHGETDKMV